MPTKEELKKAKEMNKLLEPMTRAEFLEQFEALIDFIKEVKNTNLDELKTFKQMSDSLSRNSDKKISGVLSSVDGMIESKIISIQKRLEEKEKEIDARLQSVKNGRDGRDADENRIIESVRSKIKLPEIPSISEDMPKLGTEIRNALELLRDEDRLELSAINGLEDKLEEIKEQAERKPLGKSGGGFSYIAMDRHFVDDETPSGTVNGTNKVFTIAKTPNPTASLKVLVNGMRMSPAGEDYTLSARTITFITAPPTGSIIRADYRF